MRPFCSQYEYNFAISPCADIFGFISLLRLASCWAFVLEILVTSASVLVLVGLTGEFPPARTMVKVASAAISRARVRRRRRRLDFIIRLIVLIRPGRPWGKFLSDRKNCGNTYLHYDENVMVAAEF